MLPETRIMLDLESHWSNIKRPYVEFSSNPDIYEERFSRLLDLHPLPEGFEPAGRIDKDEETNNYSSDSNYNHR
jgi:hypothetical protein